MFRNYRFAAGPAIIRWYETRNAGKYDVELAWPRIHLTHMLAVRGCEIAQRGVSPPIIL